MGSKPSTAAMELFAAAQELRGAERAAYLDRVCRGDSGLRSELDSLLAAADRAGAFLESEAHQGWGGADLFPGAEIEKVGAVIGHYKLLGQIGEGGFGTVFMAEQAQPVRRKVALKIIKPGMDTRQVVARFEAERQALAILDHPNIAKVLDAGATSSGRPYFVMELVRGVPITEFCDANRLCVVERLELFVAVCGAVQHAHQKGIIHRDLKPGNVLVTTVEGNPLPKVIDFGVAKATDQQLTEKTLFTEFRQMIGTPQYMSPEQAEMSGTDVDTRSDVYSLGVLLYELLVGATPFDPRELRARGYGEMQRILREVEPPRPSTKLSTMTDRLASVAAQRKIEPGKLGQILRGELDWIVLRAMEKDRARRYESASGLADDVRRYLAAEEVTAAPPSRVYRVRKFVRRNKGAVVAAALIVASLLAGVVGTGIALLEARKQTKLADARLIEANNARAEEARQRLAAENSARAALVSEQLARSKERQATLESARSGRAARLMTEMLSSVAPRVALGRDTTLMREILDRTVTRIGSDLRNEPDLEADLLRTIGKTYFDLREGDRYEQVMREVLRLRQAAHKGDDPLVADALEQEAQGLRAVGRLEEAEVFARQAADMRARLPGTSDNARNHALGTLAIILLDLKRPKESEQIYRKILEKGVSADLEYACGGLARCLYAQGLFEEARRWQEEGLKFVEKPSASSPGATWALVNYADMLIAVGDTAGAEKALKETLEATTRFYPPDHPNVKGPRGRLIRLYESEGKTDEADALRKEQEAAASRPVSKLPDRYSPSGDEAMKVGAEELEPPATTRPARPPLALNYFGAGEELAEKGDFPGASKEFGRQLKVHPGDSQAMMMLGSTLAESWSASEYAAHCHHILLQPGGAQDYVFRRIPRACLLLPTSAGDTELAAAMADKELARAENAKDLRLLAFAELIKGQAEYRLGHDEAAVEWTSRGIKPVSRDEPLTLFSETGYAVLALAQHRLGREDAARQALKTARAALDAHWFSADRADIGKVWPDVVMLHVWLREAELTMSSSGRAR